MTTLSGNSNLPPQDAACSVAVPNTWRLGAVDEQLMPYGKAAKAIFVKANGLAAYYRATRPPRYVA